MQPNKKAPRGAPESSGKRIRGPANSQFSGERPSHPLGHLERRPSAVSRGVWMRAERAPGEPADGHGRRLRRGRTGRLSDRMPSGRRRSRAPKAQRARAAAPSVRASAAPRGVVAHQRRARPPRRWCRGSRLDAARGAPRAGAAKIRAPTSPNSSAPVIRMPVAGSAGGLGRGERGGDARCRCPARPATVRAAARAPRARPASTARTAPPRGEPHGSGRRAGAGRAPSADQRRAPRADHPDRHQPAGHRLRLRLGIEVGHDPAAHRLGRASRSGWRPRARSRRAGASRARRRRATTRSAASPAGQQQQRRPRPARAETVSSGRAASASAAEAGAEERESHRGWRGRRRSAGARPGSRAPRDVPRRGRAAAAAPGVPASRGAASTAASSRRASAWRRAQADGGLLGALLARCGAGRAERQRRLGGLGGDEAGLDQVGHVLLEGLGADAASGRRPCSLRSSPARVAILEALAHRRRRDQDLDGGDPALLVLLRQQLLRDDRRGAPRRGACGRSRAPRAGSVVRMRSIVVTHVGRGHRRDDQVAGLGAP